MKKTYKNATSLKDKWDELVEKLTQQFSEGDELSLDSIIYLIGVQELGQGKKQFKKDEKVNQIGRASCRERV